ncbi:MAG: YraN family protein [Candidatus Kerfeldbacteria bacterium]|nr:YraN family protein [Candidatus Kerfeldbacteria bacterium]
MDKKQRGNFGEELVAQRLRELKFNVVKCNVHTRYGELDVVAIRNGVLHIIEVKARSTRAFGFEETVTQKKLRKIILAVHDAHAKHLIPKGAWCIDVAFVWLGDPNAIQIKWVWNVGL